MSVQVQGPLRLIERALVLLACLLHRIRRRHPSPRGLKAELTELRRSETARDQARPGRGLGSSLRHARPSSYSCAGTLDYGWPEAEVACSSMSDRSKVLPGTVAAGVRSGSLSFLQGTSVAAPFVARQLMTAFVTEKDGPVEKAARENYRPLLAGEYGGNNAERRARLGEVLVPPHLQPGVDVDLLA